MNPPRKKATMSNKNLFEQMELQISSRAEISYSVFYVTIYNAILQAHMVRIALQKNSFRSFVYLYCVQ